MPSAGRMDDHDRLAAGTLCGHIIECGAQCNGGNFTDWRLVPDYDDMGFPVAEVSADGSFVLGKPDGTGGLITHGDRGRADALRDRRSARLHGARRGLRLHPGDLRAGRQGPRARVGRQGPAADRHLQGLDHLARRLQAQHHLHAGRARGGGQGPAQRRRHHQEDAPHVPREEHGRLPRPQHRDHRRRGDLRPARAHPGQPRGGGQDRRQARPEGGARPARPRDRADGDRRRGRHDRQLRRRPRLALAGDPHVLLPGAQDPGAGDDRDRRPQHHDGACRQERRLHAPPTCRPRRRRRRRCRPPVPTRRPRPCRWWRWPTAARATRATTPISASSRAGPNTSRSSMPRSRRRRWRSTSPIASRAR